MAKYNFIFFDNKFSQRFLEKILCRKIKRILYLQTLGWGTLAQLVEQRTENPCVPGSIPGGTT